jgi:hypothetical protein
MVNIGAGTGRLGGELGIVGPPRLPSSYQLLGISVFPRKTLHPVIKNTIKSIFKNNLLIRLE